MWLANVGNVQELHELDHRGDRSSVSHATDIKRDEQRNCNHSKDDEMHKDSPTFHLPEVHRPGPIKCGGQSDTEYR